MGLASRRQTITWSNDKNGQRNPNFNGGRYIDDKGYVRVLKSDHRYANKGYVYEHRLVVEKFLGRVLHPWETIHHINEIKLDNRPANLFLTTIPEHSSIHREGKKQSAERRKKTGALAKERIRKGNRTKGGKFVKNPSEGDILEPMKLESNE